jgi:hypothetical protein
MSEDWVDGNELAGALVRVFTADVTSAVGVCAQCGRTGALAETRVFTRAPGMVARCRGCEQVVVRVVESADRLWLDLTGLRSLQIEIPA